MDNLTQRLSNLVEKMDCTSEGEQICSCGASKHISVKMQQFSAATSEDELTFNNMLIPGGFNINCIVPTALSSL